MRTPQQIQGLQFEIWLELLFKAKGYSDVLRDVLFYRMNVRKHTYDFRQADLYLPTWKNNSSYKLLVEAKHTTQHKVPYDLRGAPVKKSRSKKLYTLIDEVLDRKRFIGADGILLITNKRFDKRVYHEAKKHDILLFDALNLEKIYSQELGLYGDFQDSIASITLDKYNLKKNILYL